MTTRRVKFQTLTDDERSYYGFLKAEYNDLPTQVSFANSLNISNNSKNRIKRALEHGNRINIHREIPAYNETEREARRYTERRLTPENIDIIRNLFRRHRTVEGTLRNLNTRNYPVNRKAFLRNRVIRTLKQRLTAKNAKELANIQQKYNKPINAMFHSAHLNLKPEEKLKLQRQLQYLHYNDLTSPASKESYEIYRTGLKNDLKNTTIMNYVRNSGAFST